VQPDPSVDFQLSQRADHIIKAIASRVRFNRALINPKWESFYGQGNSTRLHLLFGEANQMEYAYALKVGTTCMMLDLIEDHLIDSKYRVLDPLTVLREVSRDSSFKWLVELEDGTTICAVDLHRHYIALAQRYRGRSYETDWILDNWSATIDQLEKDPLALADRLDWVAKKKIVEEYIADSGVEWGDDSLHSIDLEYHNIDPEKSLYHALVEMGQVHRIIDDVAIVDAMTEAPPDTRAFGRSKLIKWLIDKRAPSYWVDWDAVYLDRQTVVELPDPLDPYADSVAGLGKL
jgi:proteasome accessory factor A